MPVQQFGDLLNNLSRLRSHLLKVFISALVLAGLAAAFADQKLSTFFAHTDQESYRIFFRAITDIGLSEYYFLIALLAWVCGAWIAPALKWTQNKPAAWDRLRRWGLNFLAALLVSGLLIHITKFFTGRQRPHKSEVFDPFIFDPITTHWHWHSFASGHSQVIFTAATMMSVMFPKLRWGFVLFAATICFSRVVVLDHFLSDTIMGASIGYMGSLIAMSLMKRKTKNGLY